MAKKTLVESIVIVVFIALIGGFISSKLSENTVKQDLTNARYVDTKNGGQQITGDTKNGHVKYAIENSNAPVIDKHHRVTIYANTKNVNVNTVAYRTNAQSTHVVNHNRMVLRVIIIVIMAIAVVGNYLRKW